MHLSLQLITFAFASVTSLLAASWVHAAEYECDAYGDVRHISLDYPGINHLCEVSVTKRGKLPEIKWYADHDSKFCSDKFKDLVGKYQNEWDFSCQSWPDRLGLDLLSDRHRELVDNVLKEAIKEGQSTQSPYRVTGARVSSTQLSNGNNSSVVVAQLFLQNATETDQGFTNRTYYIEDDGTSFNTSIIPKLENNITPTEDGYRLHSAIVSAVLPSGYLEVVTTIFSPINLNQPQCFGTQYFKPTAAGTLESVNPHRFICNV